MEFKGCLPSISTSLRVNHVLFDEIWNFCLRLIARDASGDPIIFLISPFSNLNLISRRNVKGKLLREREYFSTIDSTVAGSLPPLLEGSGELIPRAR